MEGSSPTITDVPNDPEEELLSRHRKERKDLQAKVQALKKSATKGDKKKKKEATEEIAKLEAELEQRHAAELQALKESTVAKQMEDISEKLELISVDGEMQEGKDRVTRAQKRREKKTNKQKERERLLDEQEVENLQGSRHLEMMAFKELLEKRGLELFEVPSDGNCMYVALRHQLEAAGDRRSVTQLRELTSQFMLTNRDEFEPFWDNESGVDSFETYCEKIATTAEWGGNLELRALSQLLKRPIEVLTAGNPPILIGEEFRGDGRSPLVLTYHRHMFGLGEHYNSVRPRTQSDDESNENTIS